MSYGWLTESALIPKPAKKINVDNQKLIDLQVMLEKEKGKINNKKNNRKTFEITKNKGVEMRNIADIKANKESTNVKNKLLEKSKIYDMMIQSGAKSSEGLIDFQQKKFDSQTSEEKKKYEEERKRFYDEKRNEMEEREQEIIKKRIQHASGDLFKELDKGEAERLDWEKEAFREIEEGLTEEMILNRVTHKPVVLQVYDKKLTQEEKEALHDVIEESKAEKEKIEEIKRKRQEMLDVKKEKLRKLGVIDSAIFK